MGVKRFMLSTNELQWIINSLNHDITDTKNEMDSAPDGAPIQSFGELMIENRQNLVRKISDIIKSNVKSVGVY